mmetsp:Transcript_28861/g.50785  ORF Transcript_28861/g.50785 Transcript_28861/m.50785 type:complete len:243 (+) Transcript_28861:86-814(+)
MAGLVFEGVAARILGVIFGVYAVILLFASKSWTSLFFTEDLILGTAAEFFLRVMLVGSILSLCICCLAFPESVGVRRSVLILCVLMLIQYSLTLAYGENIHSNMFKLQFCGVLLYFLLALYWNIEGGDNPFKFGTNKCQDLSKTWPTLLMAANFLVYGILMSFFTCRFYSLHWEEEMKVWDLTWFYGLHSGLFFLAMGIGGLLDYSSSDGTKRMCDQYRNNIILYCRSWYPIVFNVIPYSCM